MKLSILSIFITLNAYSTNLDSFISAIGKVESNNNPKAIGDNGRSLGIYQIQLACYLDAKKFDKSIHFNYQSLTNTNNSKRILIAYLKRWESLAVQQGDWQTLSRLWNGGCNWRNKTGPAKRNLDSYVQKVEMILK